MESLLAIIGCIFLPLITVILIVWLKSNETRKRYQFQAELYAKAIEQGKSLPSDLFAVPRKRRYSLNAGIICIAAGIGIALSMWLMSVITTSVFSNPASDGSLESIAAIGFQLLSKRIIPYASLGIIPFFIGVAFIIIHFIEKEQEGDNEKTQ